MSACYQELALQGRSGAEVFERLFWDEPVAVLLESPLLSERTGRYSVLAARPRRTLVPPLGQVLPSLKAWLGDVRPVCAGLQELPFRGGLVGWFGYDLAWELERLPWLRPDTLPFPVAYWFEPRVFAVADHLYDRLWLVSEEDLEHWQARLEQPAPRDDIHQQSGLLEWQPDRATFLEMVNQTKAHIRRGDIFQANLSARFSLARPGGGWQLYRQLVRVNPSPFASYWRTPYGEVASCSPERLVELRGRTVSTRPIAGTRPRGTTLDHDATLAADLLASPKEKAEHIMLVDLERNDLGRVCRPGTVQVDQLLQIERYSHVMHLVSNITGELQPDLDAIDLIRAVFPGGTITGCPKVRCMEIVETLEPVRRSLFYGSCGYLGYDGELDLNILIRTLLLSDSRVWGQVGAGIVADSDPEREFDEVLDKAKAQWAALGLL
ncbi:MAG: anthranilate synthase component I [Gemmatimonadaceae bacterium]|nr:anthranilate synthase component I [Gloeobacterales cyanobacterium ES-bin-141]